MRIETHQGHDIVCGHIFAADQIAAGQQWMGSSGATVTVDSVDGDMVAYSWVADGTVKSHKKVSFAFQCRYCLIVDDFTRNEKMHAAIDSI